MVFISNGKLHVSTYSSHHQVLTTFLLQEFYIICLNRVVMLRSMSINNSNDTIGNRTRDPPTCNAVPQPNAAPRARRSKEYCNKCSRMDAVAVIKVHETVRVFFYKVL